MHNNIFQNKNILITGHTGFKGSWLSQWLSILGANVIGVSNDIPTDPAHYNLIKDNIIEDIRANIINAGEVYSIINSIKPNFIFHLAAQPIVYDSYLDPLNTFVTNAIGTANILDALRQINHECIAIMITSDKCYENVEKQSGYLETDRLGGKDPYSGSKAAAEIILRSYVQSFFKNKESNVRLAIGRAGNVIGGGDWAPNRIIPDCMRSWSVSDKPIIRSPFSTRPWQHVLEPLSGYLSLANSLNSESTLNGEVYNFGPPRNQNYTVKELVNELIIYWPGAEWVDGSSENKGPHEAGLLKLNCNKALQMLNWKATLNFKETSKWTSDWYRTYYQEGPINAKRITIDQIEEYMNIAEKRNSFNLG